MQQFEALTHSQSSLIITPTTLPTTPQSPVHQEGTHHDLTEHSELQGIQGKSQRLTSSISNTPLTKPHAYTTTWD